MADHLGQAIGQAIPVSPIHGCLELADVGACSEVTVAGDDHGADRRIGRLLDRGVEVCGQCCGEGIQRVDG